MFTLFTCGPAFNHDNRVVIFYWVVSNVWKKVVKKEPIHKKVRTCVLGTGQNVTYHAQATEKLDDGKWKRKLISHPPQQRNEWNNTTNFEMRRPMKNLRCINDGKLKRKLISHLVERSVTRNE